jgi:hypothetical protein
MDLTNHRRLRAGALALGLAAVLLTAFPLVRPFFDLDPREPERSLRLAIPVITSLPWVAAHLMAMLAFVLLVFGLLALYARLARTPAESRALRALVWSLAGVALIMPMLGVETHVLPILGGLHASGATGLAPAIGALYLGPAMLVFVLGLLALAVGVIAFARIVWRTQALPRWAGVVFAAGLALWFPPFPRGVRVVDGFLIGLGGVWLAWELWRDATPPATPRRAAGSGSGSA